MYSLAIDLLNTQIVYSGTLFTAPGAYGGGVYKSINGGSSWIAVNNGLSNLNVTSLAIVPTDTQIVYAGTWGGGIFKLFIIRSFVIASSSSSGGSISPLGNISANSGENQTFTITPNTGYTISNVKVDGTFVGAVSLYTFSNITANHIIEGTFEKEITTITTILQIGNMNFTVNGVSNTLDSPPVIKNNRTLLPIRAIIESLGGTVSWDATERKVTVSLGSTNIELWIGKSTAKVNGINTAIDSSNTKVVPEIINSRTMLPLRFVAENLGCDVQWDGTTQTITITYQP